MRYLEFQILIYTVFTISSSFSKGDVCRDVDVRNGIEGFKNLENCTVVIGFLKILLIEHKNSSYYENVTFPKLTDIRGYLLFYRVSGLTSLGKMFPNLSTIRGTSLFLDYYSFIIYDCKDIIEIGLKNLKYIERGSTRIGKCPKLCYVHTVDWPKISHYSHHLYFDNENEDCNQTCPKNCKNCWNENNCQEDEVQTCSSECIGCTGPTARECRACKLYIDNRTCISSCPKDKVLHAKLGRCIDIDECNSRTLSGSWKIEDDKCVYSKAKKVCNGTVIDTMASCILLRGCTHIKGSLMIRIIEEQSSFNLKDLSSIIEISDYLMIYRSDLVDLNFFKNLRIVRGEKLYNNHYAIVVHSNPNLQKLWNWNEFGFELKRGNISFHYNSKLCQKEIQSFAKIANVTFDEVDVSPYSNGNKQICNLIKLNVTVKSNDTNATLWWNSYTETSSNVTIIGYVIYYIQDTFNNMTLYNEKTECEDDDWKSIFVTDNNVTLINLNSFTTYAFYIQIYTSLSLGSGRTEIDRFTTNISSPELIDFLQADAYSSDSITLYWKPPIFSNGKITHHNLFIYRQEDDADFVAERNYCKNPHIFLQENNLHFPTQKTFPEAKQPKDEEDCCNGTKSKMKAWLSNFCSKVDHVTLSNSKFKPCKDFMNAAQRVLPEQDLEIHDDFVIKNSMSMVKPAYFVVDQMIPDGTITSYKVENLSYFNVYIFLIQACRGENFCSNSIYSSERTMKKPEADDIPSRKLTAEVDGKNVKFFWRQPKYPNSMIVAYQVEYKKSEWKNSTIKCLTMKKFKQHGMKYKMENVSPGKYTARVRAVSLAGPGRFTNYVDFEIEFKPHEMSIELVIVLTLTFLLLLVFGVYYYYYNNKSREQQREEIDILLETSFVDSSGPLYHKDEFEIARNDVEISVKIGQGSFGLICSGIIRSTLAPCMVIVGNDSINAYQKLAFLNEASIMKSFNNSNHVIKLIGIVSSGVPLVLLELMSRGDLKTYLRRRRNAPNAVTPNEQYRMAAQIADGLLYLTSKKFVHKDLAARNCMVASDHTVKIGDFGMPKHVMYEEDYYKKTWEGDLIPARWMAPESLSDGLFTIESNSWSYGIILWEIVTLAEQPYQGLSHHQVLQFVISQGTLQRPFKCPDLLYEIMSACWKFRPSLRATFTDVVEKLEIHAGQHFKLVSFYHSSEGEEWRFNNRNTQWNPEAFWETFDEARSVHWDTSFDEISF